MKAFGFGLALRQSRRWLPSIPAIARGVAAYTGNVLADADAFETWLGRDVDYHLVSFNQTSQAAFISSIPFIADLHAGRANIWSIPMFGGGSNFAQLNAGNFDANHTTCAQAILAAAPPTVPIIVRFGWEFNLAGQPWFVGTDTAGYIAGFRRLVAIYRAVSPRFRLDWCPNVLAQGMTDPSAAYPGDDVVDVIGMDCYWTNGQDSAAAGGLGHFNFVRDAEFGLQWQVDFAESHGKPVAMTEWAANDDAAPAFVSAMSDWLRDNEYLYHGYWNGDHNGESCRISNGDNPALALAYRSYFGAPTITSASTFAAATGAQFSTTLASDQSTTIGVVWSVVSGVASISGSTLTIPASPAGAVPVTVRATNPDGISTNQAITVTFAAPHNFVNAEASAYVARMTATPAEDRKALIDALFTRLKSGATSGTNILAKLDTLYLLAAHDAQAARLNAKSSTLYPALTAVNDPPFVINRGYTPALDSGTARYLSTGQGGTATGDLFTQNSASFGAWTLTNLASNSGVIGNGSAVTLCPRSSGDQIIGFTNDFSNWAISQTDARGLTAANRSTSTAKQLYKNGAQVASLTQASASPGAGVIILGGSSAGFPEARQLAFAFTGGSLTAAEHADLHAAAAAYLAGVGAV